LIRFLFARKRLESVDAFLEAAGAGEDDRLLVRAFSLSLLLSLSLSLSLFLSLSLKHTLSLSRSSPVAVPLYRRRANVAHVRQSRPDSGLDFQVKVLKILSCVPWMRGAWTPSWRRRARGRTIVSWFAPSLDPTHFLSLSHTHTRHTHFLSHTHFLTLSFSLTHTHTLSLSHTLTHTHTHTHSSFPSLSHSLTL